MRRAIGSTVLACLLLPVAPAAGEAPDAVDALLAEAKQAMQDRDYPTAAGRYARASELKPDDPEIWYRLAVCRGRLNETAAAVEAYRRTVRLDPGHAKAHHNLGNIFFRQGDPEASAEAYGAALEADPDYLLAAFHYGWVLRQLNRSEQAAGAFERCLEIPADDPRGKRTHADCLFGLGSLRHRAGDYTASATMMEQVVAVHPGHPEARYYLGMAYRQLGRMDEAREQLQIHARMMDARESKPIEKQTEP